MFIVEGERKVDTLLEKFGAFAVCADTGSKSKWQPELARLLCDLPLILWPTPMKRARNTSRTPRRRYARKTLSPTFASCVRSR